ncbi:MAG: radical SAM protein, partial [Deltaproteobacteria bacterium]|nr:radical SAM protein [Deltaproteobacteria bacterium]
MDTWFEQGPIRPPSEAGSLLIRATRNCPWNKCAFCHTYKGETFAIRGSEEVKNDIYKAAKIADSLEKFSREEGEGGVISAGIVRKVLESPALYNDAYRAIAMWLYYGGRHVFIQDADSLTMKTGDMALILRCLRETFPAVKRITTYCRSKTAARKPLAELELLREAGLSRIHVGMESGLDPLLKLIRKGVTAREHIEAGHKIKAAGISLCEYVMPGLGGKVWSHEHASETARVINRINPDFMRLRSLQVAAATPLGEMTQKGEFTPLGDEEVLSEIRELISGLEDISTTIVSDHMFNLLEELEGTLPADKTKLLTTIDRF